MLLQPQRERLRTTPTIEPRRLLFDMCKHLLDTFGVPHFIHAFCSTALDQIDDVDDLQQLQISLTRAIQDASVVAARDHMRVCTVVYT